MIEAFLPKVSDCDMEKLLTNIERNDVWNVVPTSPTKEKSHELIVYNFLADLNSRVTDEYTKLVPGSAATVNLVIHGSKTPETNRRNSSRPDGSWLLPADKADGDTDDPNYLRMVGAFEFKKKDKGDAEMDVSRAPRALPTFLFIVWVGLLQDIMDTPPYHAE